MIFSRGKSYKRLLRNLENVYSKHLNSIVHSNVFSKDQKNVLSAVLTSTYFIATNLISNITQSKLNLSEFVDENAEIEEAFAYASYMHLDGLNQRIKNKPELKQKLGVTFEWITSALSQTLGVDKNFYSSLLKQAQDARKRGIDPRDFWLEQDFQFYDMILTRNFDIRNYFKDNMAKLLMLSLSSQQLRISEAHLFDEFFSEGQDKSA